MGKKEKRGGREIPSFSPRNDVRHATLLYIYNWLKHIKPPPKL
jgi:hypothetical protein